MPALMRGGKEIAVRLADRSFTVRIPRADALHALREQPGVEDATPLTRTLVRVTAGDVQRGATSSGRCAIAGAGRSSRPTRDAATTASTPRAS